MDRNDLISRSELKKTIINICGNCSNIIREYKDGVPDGNCAIQHIMNLIDNAPTVKTYCYFCGQAEHGVEERPQGDIRWTDKLSVKSNGDIIDFEGRVVGHINLEEMKGVIEE